MRSHTFTVTGFALVLIFYTSSSAWTGLWSYSALNDRSESVNQPEIFVLNQDQFAGSWKQFKGELKEEWGEFTDDDLLQIEGKLDKFEGKMQERYGDRKEELREWTDKWFERHTFESQSSRHKQ